MDNHSQHEAAQDVEFLNLLLEGLDIPLNLTTPVDLTPSLLIAILESLVQDRLPLTPGIRNARDFGSKVEAMKVFLGVLGDDVIGVDIGLAEVDPRRLAHGEWDETIFVGRVLIWIGGELDIIDRSELPDFIKETVAANLTTSTFAQASTNQAPRHMLLDQGPLATNFDTAPDPRTRLKAQLPAVRPPSRSFDPAFEGPSIAGPSTSRISAISSLSFQPDSTSSPVRPIRTRPASVPKPPSRHSPTPLHTSLDTSIVTTSSCNCDPDQTSSTGCSCITDATATGPGAHDTEEETDYDDPTPRTGPSRNSLPPTTRSISRQTFNRDNISPSPLPDPNDLFSPASQSPASTPVPDSSHFTANSNTRNTSVRRSGWIEPVNHEQDLRSFEASRANASRLREKSQSLSTLEGLSRGASRYGERTPGRSGSLGERVASRTPSSLGRGNSSRFQHQVTRHTSPTEHALALLKERARLLEELAELRLGESPGRGHFTNEPATHEYLILHTYILMDDIRNKENNKDFTFAKLSDLNLPVTFRISQLEGIRKPRSYADILENPDLRFAGVQSEGLSDLYVTCQLIADNKPLTIQYRTGFKAFKHSYTWNEWITLPVKYCDLPLNSQITFTVWDIANPRTAVPVGGSTFRLFGKKWTLRRGKHRLLLWPGQEADGSMDTRTPSKIGGAKDEMGRLEKAETEKSDNLYLYIDLPRFDFPVIFSELKDQPSSSTQPQSQPNIPTAPSSAIPKDSQPTLNIQQDVHVWQIVDPEIGRENPVEDKHRRLVRSHRSGPLDRELKPNAHDRDALTAILNYPPTRLLTPDDKDLIWRFRFYLTREKKGLTKFLKSVTWKDPAEVKQAVEVVLPLWTDIGTDDALELLGPTTVDARVRRFAVKQLARSDDDELFLYLLQLVQALRFENVAGDNRTARGGANGGTSTPASKEDSALAEFLIERGVRSPILGNRLHWYLMVEVEDKVNGRMYAKVAFKFMEKLMEVEGGATRRNLLKRQGELVASLSARAKELRSSKDARPKKIEKLRAYLADPKNNFTSMQPLPHPLNSRVEINGMIPEKCSIFKSNLSPMLLYFQCTPGDSTAPAPGDESDTNGSDPSKLEEYPIIFKNGDDLRQDQLVIQLFTLMDRLLRKENLDLKISPYDVLATGPKEGMVQFIPSMTIASVVSEYTTVLAYLRKHHPDEGSVGTYGVKPAVIDTFVRSCAGYCVLTYILGVGDRHLDNLLVAPDGHFFHVDFGYILGRDPKPMPPPVKLCREMVDGMGGAQSPHYARFKNLCFTAFSILRKSANLILNLVALMVDANIEDLKHRDVHGQLQDKFRLDLSEEEAIRHFEALLNEWSYFTVVMDRIHDIAQYWKS